MGGTGTWIWIVTSPLSGRIGAKVRAIKSFIYQSRATPLQALHKQLNILYYSYQLVIQPNEKCRLQFGRPFLRMNLRGRKKKLLYLFPHFHLPSTPHLFSVGVGLSADYLTSFVIYNLSSFLFLYKLTHPTFSLTLTSSPLHILPITTLTFYNPRSISFVMSARAK